LPERPSVKKTTNLRPKKRLGQHFLRDPAVIDEIIRLARFNAGSAVVEIGPGLGALTLPLADRVRQVIGIEKDFRLIEILQVQLLKKRIGNVTLIREDVLKADFRAIARSLGENLQVIGNLPFNISTPFLGKLIGSRDVLSRAVLTFQAEVGHRLIAAPGNKQYGAMTVLAQYHARILPLLEIPKQAFYPPPKVGSMVIEIDFTRPHATRAGDDEMFGKTVKGAFAHRRKTLPNSLKGAFPHWPLQEIVKAVERSGVEPKTRAEVLGIDDFIRLSKALGSV
jgi:16S rRNA (adenine1518-N6/adenine1519-N6)-dimethyltransferase